jgi:hypothetical protein
MAASAILNVLENGYGHYIIIMNDREECDHLLALGNGRIDSCAWMSGPIEDDPTDPYIKPSDIHVRWLSLLASDAQSLNRNVSFSTPGSVQGTYQDGGCAHTPSQTAFPRWGATRCHKAVPRNATPCGMGRALLSRRWRHMRVSRWSPQVTIELGTRHYFVWRFLQQCINTLWMDTDVHISRNIYPYFKGALKDVNLVMKEHHMSRVELNTGIMYAQNVQPAGSVANSFLLTFNNWKWGIQQLQVCAHALDSAACHRPRGAWDDYRVGKGRCRKRGPCGFERVSITYIDLQIDCYRPAVDSSGLGFKVLTLNLTQG